MLSHIISTAQKRDYRRLYLETGTGEAFVPAHRLYETHGFREGPAFGDYTANSFSRFYSLDL